MLVKAHLPHAQIHHRPGIISFSLNGRRLAQLGGTIGTMQ